MIKLQGIYTITHIESGRTYVGSSKNVMKRLASHKSDLKNNKHHNPALQNYYNKYGKDSFTFELKLSVIDIRDLITEENNYMLQLGIIKVDKSMNYELGFNTQIAGQTGCVDPANYKSGEEHHLFGTVGHNKDKIFDAETRANMSAGQKGKKYTNRKAMSQDIKNSISETKKNKPWSKARRDAQNKKKKST